MTATSTLREPAVMYSRDAVHDLQERENACKSKGEEHLKQMAKNQLDSHCSLKEAKKGREFIAWAWQPVSDLKGKMGLEEYERAETEEKRLDELRQCGLNKREIELISMHNQGMMPSTVHPHAAHCHVEEIQRKIRERERRVEFVGDYGSGVCLVGRRTLETESVDFRCPKDLRHLVQLKKRNVDGVVDKAVEETLKEEREREEKRKTQRNKGYRRKEEAREEDGRDEMMKKDEESLGKGEGCESAAILKDDGDHACSPVQMTHCVSEEEIKSNRLSVEEIRKIPRFSAYSHGVSSHVLYIKNLHCRVTESDLLPLFLQYQNQNGAKLVFRLLTGRMRGQAFVTFPSVACAEQAFQLLNGYMLKGRPMIIEYGHCQSQD